MLQLNYMYIKVKVITSANKEKIEKKSDDYYIISVKEKAKMNLANNRVREIISSLFEVSFKSVRIISGHQSSSKILSIRLLE